MTNEEKVFEYCKKQNRKVTAQEIIKALFPGKPQPYINATINNMVQKKRLVRDDTTRPYTVRLSYEGEEIENVKDYSRGPNKGIKKEVSVVKKTIRGRDDIPKPSVQEVKKYINSWYELENYTIQEKSLDKLFFVTYPANNKVEEVLVKVATLNDFYSTNIFNAYQVAKHILSLNIDERLKHADISLVNDIAKVKMENGETKNFYSFATKYCSHHEPMSYAIYDSYVDKVLRYFRKVDNFCEFNDVDLKDYEKFVMIIGEFQKYYGLEKFNLKEIDRYLWQLGKEKFPKSYGKK